MTEIKKIALVTGASRGIGQAIATTLASQVDAIVGTATTAAGAAAITKHLQAQGCNGIGVVLNLCEQDAMLAALEQVKTHTGAYPNILVNNAGITRDNILLRMKDAQWDEVLLTNLTSVFQLSKRCLKYMLKGRWGRVINIASLSGVMGNEGQSNYAAAKAGLLGFTKSAAKEFAAYGITINAVAPGFIDTDMTSALDEKVRNTVMAHVPMKRFGLPEEVAASVDFLASSQASYITGTTIHVNGGMYMV